MTQRGEALQSFVNAAYVAFDLFVHDPHGRRSVREIFEALMASEGEISTASGSRLPVCLSLDAALGVSVLQKPLRDLLDCFKAIEPQVTWRRRSDDQGTASENYFNGHGNAIICGPGGIEHRHDAWLGLSLLAPNVRYPDHNHAPEEVYLVVSEGEFSQDDGPWFSPGIGGTFYNRPQIKHAMRAGNTPLLAVWILQPERHRNS